MQSLLRWSIENSSASASSTATSGATQRKDLDPAIIDMILGRPDAELMKEDMSVAVNPERSDADRVDALEHLEMLVENIDNANDLATLGLWEPLHALLTDPRSTSQIKTQVLWVIGTALQNNPAAQDAYLLLEPLATLVSFLTPTVPSLPEKVQGQLTAKAMYVLSGLLKHNAPAVRMLDDPNVQGWDGLKEALQHPEITVRRKAIFLINTLLFPSSPSPSTTVQPNIHTSSPAAQLKNEQEQQPNPPVHPNSHSAHIASPTRALTAPLTHLALLTHPFLLSTIVQSLTSPLPHGHDGDLGLRVGGDGDGDDEVDGVDEEYEEAAVRVVYRYIVTWSGDIERALREEMKDWLLGKIKRARSGQGEQEGENLVAENWRFDVEELRELVRRLG